MKQNKLIEFVVAAVITGFSALIYCSPVAVAQTSDGLRQRIEAMEKQIKEMKAQLEATERKAESAKKKAEEEENRNINWHLAGYATADYTATNESGSSDSFGGGKFAPIFLVSYRDLISFEGELELSTNSEGETDTELEFANLNVTVNDWLTLTAGKFLSPIGDFQQHQHPDWINKLPDRPAGFVEDGGTEPLSDVGIMARGAFPVGSMMMDYAVFVGNGPRLAEEADEGVKLEGFGSDDNGNKSVGGRIGIRPVPYLSLGVSAMTAKIKGNSGAGGNVTSGDYNVFALDAAFTRGNWDVRGEYIWAHLDSLMTAPEPTDTTEVIPASAWRAAYVQAAYRLAGVTKNPILARLEPVIRYSRFQVSGFEDFKINEEDRWSVGLNYWITPSSVVKLAYESKDFEHKEDEDVFRAQLSYGF